MMRPTDDRLELSHDDDPCRRLADWGDAVEAIAECPEARREWLWLHSGAREDWRGMADLEQQDPELRSRLGWALERLAQQDTPSKRRQTYAQLSDECFARHARRLLSTPCDCGWCAPPRP